MIYIKDISNGWNDKSQSYYFKVKDMVTN